MHAMHRLPQHATMALGGLLLAMHKYLFQALSVPK